MEKLSIIVPVYNVELYLEQCLDSLVKQTFQDIKIIIVNDGSIDNSKEIIEQYIKTYPHLIEAVDKINGGLASARNYGMKYAKGDYISFIDSDDHVDKEMFQQMVDKMEREEQDIVLCNMLYFYEDSKRNHEVKGLNLDWNHNIEFSAFLSPLSVCNKLFKRSLFDNVLFPDGLWNEDIPVITAIYTKTNKIGWIDKPYYYYRQRNESIMHSSYNEKMLDIFVVLKMMLDFQKANNTFEKYYNELEYLFIENCLYYGAFRFLRTDRYNMLIDKCVKTINEFFPRWRKNPYLKNLSLKNRIFVKTISVNTAMLYRTYLRLSK